MKTSHFQIATAFGLLLAALSSGCASMFNKVDKESLQSTKKVALVGFTYDQQLANSGKTVLDNVLGVNDNTTGLGKVISIEASPHAAEAVAMSQRALAKKTGWTFVDQAQVLKNPAVKRFYEKKNETIQTGLAPLEPHFYRYEASGLPQFSYIQWGEKAELDAMAKSLGVDALVLMTAKTRLSQTRVLGIGVGSIGSESQVSLLVYDPRKQDFTVVLNAGGEEVDTKTGKIAGFADANEMNVQALLSYDSALAQLSESL